MLSCSEANGALPGFRSLAIAIGTRCTRSISIGGSFGLAQVRIRAGQQDRDGACDRHGLHAFLVEVLEVIGGERLVLRGERGALLVGELLGVQLDRELEFGRLGENALDLRRREADVVAVGVHGIGEPLGRGGRQDLVAYTFNIVIRPGRETRAARRGRRGASCAR